MCPDCARPVFRSTLRMGMKDKSTDKLSILQANDHFRDWRTLDDERLCALCDRKFTGHEVVISTTSDEVEMRCPTPNCQSGVHQWLHPSNPQRSEKNERDWWRALGSYGGSDNAGSAPSPEPV
jgi:hypothetical protein